jgi:predicted phosphodiesterase
MRVICISDTHLVHEETRIEIPDGDVLIHAGDATYRGSEMEVYKFLKWFSALPHKNKIFIAGNHDWLFDSHPEKAAMLLSQFPSVTYLQDSETIVNGFRIYGSPHQPWFYDWAFNLKRGPEIKAKWDLIPEGIDVLITHGPPYGFGDKVPNGELVGCVDLLEALKRVKPKLHVCGHIHLGHGLYTTPEGVIVANSSICDERYKGVNAPHVVDL